MKMTGYSNYAMRLLQPAAATDPNPLRMDVVGGVHGLTRPYIETESQQLKRAENLNTQRARSGGFRLVKAPEDMVIGSVVRLTKGPLGLVGCFYPEKNTCLVIGICKLLHALQSAIKALTAILDGPALEDISSNRGGLLARIAPLEKGAVVPMRLAK